MNLPPELKPTQIRRVIDLAKQAGFDVSKWSVDFQGNPATNPKYCYEWAFQDENVVICNIWYDELEMVNGYVEDHLELKNWAVSKDNPAVRIGRRRKMLEIVGRAYANATPIRAIILDGIRRGPGKRVNITGRLLDPKEWSVINFDRNAGKVTLRRGKWASQYADQFSVDRPTDGDGSSVTGSAKRYKRSGDIREWALNRAKGLCEYCGQRGFQLPDGRWYLETHHIVPLSEHGRDSYKNVIALCANDHRRAHVGVDREQLRKEFLEILSVIEAD
jgi:hypothetical protein